MSSFFEQLEYGTHCNACCHCTTQKAFSSGQLSWVTIRHGVHQARCESRAYYYFLVRRAAMNAVAGPSTVNNEHPINSPVLPVWDRKIQSGDTVLIRLPNAEIRSIKLESDTYVKLVFRSVSC